MVSLYFRHLWGGLWKHFCIYLALIISLMIVTQSVQLSDLWVIYGLSIENVTLPIFFMLIPYLSLAMTLACFLSIMTTYHQHCSQGALPAYIMAGSSWWRSWRPAFCMSALVSLGCWLCSHHLEHRARKEFHEFQQQKAYDRLDEIITRGLTAGAFHTDFAGYIFRSEKASKNPTSFEKVFISPSPPKPGIPLLAITASKATLEYSSATTDPYMILLLHHGTLTSVTSSRPTTPSPSLSKETPTASYEPVPGSSFLPKLKSPPPEVSTESMPTHRQKTITTFKRWRIDLLSLFNEQILNKTGPTFTLESYSPEQLRQLAQSKPQSLPALDPGQGSRNKLLPKNLNSRSILPSGHHHGPQARNILARRAIAPLPPLILALFALALSVHASRSGRWGLYLKGLIVWLALTISPLALTLTPWPRPLWSAGPWLAMAVFCLGGVGALWLRVRKPLAENIF